ncbi:MAG: 3-oxoacyl-(acyl-carrier-protein) synthase 3 [Alphaproteobacteria bacterium ADurb.BinA280]|jgi:acyl-CoA:acyl-CoA alkyltransferase|nr:3-oxoacyl-ACP synthase III [Xanthomonadales bacterium]MCC6503928.1 3-oxoacyl-ACP synthase III [Aquimonas sp.]OPZ13065.1 MAG: 3-oxoacyl-(acyl-carrier-protein) synthase 3 [Alphaproteobacteria bacterium ADurb.BinA280]
MLFQHVSIASVVHIDAPHALSSDDINERLRPTLDRLGIRADVLKDIAGIHSRRMWDDDTLASDAATLAAEKALAEVGVDRARIGLLVNTSVSRDFLEPSTASIVSGNLGLSEICQNFDVANACLAFLNGMDIASRMIERGEIDYALVVDGETANLVYEKTLQRMLSPEITEEDFRSELASLTLGCGAAAMVLARRELAPDAPRYRGGVTRAATQWNGLCRGNLDRMVTDTKMLLIEGMKLAATTFHAARQALGWAVDEIDEFVIHQVSRVHTDALVKTVGIDPRKVFTIFREHGNIGPASVPIVLSKLKEMGRLRKGQRIALLGIGSGLNCSMAEVVW